MSSAPALKLIPLIEPIYFIKLGTAYGLRFGPMCFFTLSTGPSNANHTMFNHRGP